MQPEARAGMAKTSYPSRCGNSAGGLRGADTVRRDRVSSAGTAWCAFEAASESCDKALVISPFVSNGLLQKICQSTSSAQLVARSDELDNLNADTLAGFTAGVWTLADNAVPEVEDEVDSGSADQPTPNKLVGQLRGLHAKVYVLDQGWNASVLTGSANATSAAFESNVEFLTELRGKRSKCGVMPYSVTAIKILPKVMCL